KHVQRLLALTFQLLLQLVKYRRFRLKYKNRYVKYLFAVNLHQYRPHFLMLRENDSFDAHQMIIRYFHTSDSSSTALTVEYKSSFFAPSLSFLNYEQTQNDATFAKLHHFDSEAIFIP